MKQYQSIIVVGEGAVGQSITYQLKQLSDQLNNQSLKSFNSKNIVEAYNSKPDLLIYAGVPGTKWYANQFPDKDQLIVDEALQNIKQIGAKQTILISTIDALFDDKSEYASTYGKNRKLLEDKVLEEVPNASVVQLPALKGQFVVKNFWYDIKHPELVKVTPPMYNQLNYVINLLDLDVELIQLSADHFQPIIRSTQEELDPAEFGKYFATNPYSTHVWLDLDNFVERLLSIDYKHNRKVLLVSSLNGSVAELSAFTVYRLTTDRSMTKGLRSIYKGTLPLVNYSEALLNAHHVFIAGEINFKE